MDSKKVFNITTSLEPNDACDLIVYQWDYLKNYWAGTNLLTYNIPDKVVFNKKKKTTTLLYEKGNYGKQEYDATTVKTTKGDKFDRKLGFLIAYFQKHSGMTKTQANKYLNKVTKEEIE